MSLLFILPVLFATCLGKTIPAPKEIVRAASGYAYALDLAGPVSLSTFNCIKKYGYSTVFVRGYEPTGAGKFDTSAPNNIHHANQAGLGTEVFMTPQLHSSKRGSQQFKELYEGLTRGSIKVKTVWLQVTSPINWGPNHQANIYFINDIVSMAKNYGVAIGFYTNVYDWNQITNGANVMGAMLWYWSVNGAGPNGETHANFDDFRPFAKFTKPTVKQFAQVENVCGITVNRDVYILNKSKQLMALTPNKSNGETIVGTLGAEQISDLVQII